MVKKHLVWMLAALACAALFAFSDGAQAGAVQGPDGEQPALIASAGAPVAVGVQVAPAVATAAPGDGYVRERVVLLCFAKTRMERTSQRIGVIYRTDREPPVPEGVLLWRTAIVEQLSPGPQHRWLRG